MKTLPELIVEKVIDPFVPCSVMLDVLYVLKKQEEFNEWREIMEFTRMQEIKYQLEAIEKKYKIKKEDYEESKT